MKHVTKIFIFGLLALTLLWSGLSTLYAREISHELRSLRRESRSDTVYLRSRVKEMESEIKEYLRCPVHSDGINDQTDGETQTENPPCDNVTESDSPMSDDAETESSHGSVTEELTVPVQNSPETLPNEDIPTVESSPAALYVVTEHNGIIGVFDPSGELIRSVNVLVITLSPGDREALQMGVPAYSEEELAEILEVFE
ncbi:MAG: hypothetical protein IJD38_11490 [Clostridia bacterium]|nr:hypothetical protein [Clostridia bacterium]